MRRSLVALALVTGAAATPIPLSSFEETVHRETAIHAGDIDAVVVEERVRLVVLYDSEPDPDEGDIPSMTYEPVNVEAYEPEGIDPYEAESYDDTYGDIDAGAVEDPYGGYNDNLLWDTAVPPPEAEPYVDYILEDIDETYEYDPEMDAVVVEEYDHELDDDYTSDPPVYYDYELGPPTDELDYELDPYYVDDLEVELSDDIKDMIAAEEERAMADAREAYPDVEKPSVGLADVARVVRDAAAEVIAAVVGLV